MPQETVRDHLDTLHTHGQEQQRVQPVHTEFQITQARLGDKPRTETANNVLWKWQTSRHEHATDDDDVQMFYIVLEALIVILQRLQTSWSGLYTQSSTSAKRNITQQNTTRYTEALIHRNKFGQRKTCHYQSYIEPTDGSTVDDYMCVAFVISTRQCVWPRLLFKFNKIYVVFRAQDFAYSQ